MVTKAKHPLQHLTNKQTLPLIEFYFALNQLKQLYRQGWLRKKINPDVCESVAEHTFGVAVLAMVLGKSNYPKLDMEKILKMALIHDLAEIYVGDIIPDDGIDDKEKYKREKKGINTIFSLLNDGEEYITIWEEYESCSSLEAQFVRQLDKLEMALQASVYEHQNDLDLHEFFESALMETQDPHLIKILNELDNLLT